MQLRVLAGLLYVHGHVLTPSPFPHHLFSPENSPHLPLCAVRDWTPLTEKARAALAPLQRDHIKFVSSSTTLTTTVDERSVCAIDLEEEDIQWLELTPAITCVCVVWNLDTPLESCHQTTPRGTLLPQVRVQKKLVCGN